MLFEVRIAGVLDPDIAEQFGLVSTAAGADYTLVLADVDQAGLHGLLERVRALDLELVDVRRARPPRRASP